MQGKGCRKPCLQINSTLVIAAAVTSARTAELAMCTWAALGCVRREGCWHLWQHLLAQGVIFQHSDCTGQSSWKLLGRLAAGIVTLTSRHFRSAHSPATFKEKVFSQNIQKYLDVPASSSCCRWRSCLCYRLSVVYSSISNRMKTVKF